MSSMTEQKLCRNCRRVEGPVVTNLTYCLRDYISPTTGCGERLACGLARNREWACGAEAKHFTPRKQTLSDFLKSRAGEYVTLAECAECDGGEEAFKAVDHRLIEFFRGCGICRKWWDFKCDPKDFCIKLTPEGTFPTITFDMWKKDHAGEWVTGQEYVDAGGDWGKFVEACNAVPSAVQESFVHSTDWMMCTVGHVNSTYIKSCIRIRLTDTGELPQRDWRDDIPWHLAPWAEWFCCNDFDKQHLCEIEPRLSENGEDWMFVNETLSLKLSAGNFVKIPECVSGCDTLTYRPAKEGE